MKPKGIKKEPLAQAALKEAIQRGLDTKQTSSIADVRNLLASPGIRECMEDILNTSTMTEPIKEYLRLVFLEKKSQKKAIRKAFGADLGYQENLVTTGVMNHPEVKAFLEMVKSFYVQVSPIAALKEIEILMKPTTSDETRLKAIENIHKKAGLLDSEGAKKELPVTLVINMPKVEAEHSTQAVQVNVGAKP